MWYSYAQNNSGGGFDIYPDEGIAEVVLIEAASSCKADARAEDIGIYFDGCDADRDCPCCGDRWSRSCESGAVADWPLCDTSYLGWKDVFVHPLGTPFFRASEGALQ